MVRVLLSTFIFKLTQSAFNSLICNGLFPDNERLHRKRKGVQTRFLYKIRSQRGDGSSAEGARPARGKLLMPCNVFSGLVNASGWTQYYRARDF